MGFNTESERIESSIRRVRKSCFLLKVATVLILIFATILYAAIIMVALSLQSVQPVSLFLNVIEGVSVVSALIVLYRVLSATVAERTPFPDGQSRRFVLLGVLFVLYFLAMMTGSSLLLSIPEMSVECSAGTSGKVTIDIMWIVASLIMFTFAAIVRYGMLLQELSDDTV